MCVLTLEDIVVDKVHVLGSEQVYKAKRAATLGKIQVS